jgi:hypothetical protein
MDFILRIRIDNAAFEENATGEVGDLLRLAADIIEADGFGGPGVTTHLRDSNGNKVGGFALVEG